MTAIKICGFTREGDVESAIEAGVDAVGVVLSDGPCRLGPKAAQRLVSVTEGSGVVRVAVVGRAPALEIEHAFALGFDVVQAVEPQHARHGVGQLIPVFFDSEQLLDRIQRWSQTANWPGASAPERSACADEPKSHAGRWPSRMLCVDGPKGGGKGVPANWERVRSLAEEQPVMLAGGLNAENVADAIQRTRPIAVDVSSGTEARAGVKDLGRMRAFVDAVRASGS